MLVIFFNFLTNKVAFPNILLPVVLMNVGNISGDCATGRIHNLIYAACNEPCSVTDFIHEHNACAGPFEDRVSALKKCFSNKQKTISVI